jgi:hypothetical protein
MSDDSNLQTPIINQQEAVSTIGNIGIQKIKQHS